MPLSLKCFLTIVFSNLFNNSQLGYGVNSVSLLSMNNFLTYLNDFLGHYIVRNFTEFLANIFCWLGVFLSKIWIYCSSFMLPFTLKRLLVTQAERHSLGIMMPSSYLTIRIAFFGLKLSPLFCQTKVISYGLKITWSTKLKVTMRCSFVYIVCIYKCSITDSERSSPTKCTYMCVYFYIYKETEK